MTSPKLSSWVILLMLVNRGANAINTSPIKLAVQPKCGVLDSSQFNNFNAGINLGRIKTIYGFGDSYMSNGQSTGDPPREATPDPKSAKFGGRASNGKVWIEQFGDELGALVKDYAVGGASVSRALSAADTQETDMIGHVQTFLNQHNRFDTASTMGMISYGINDWSSAYKHHTSLRSSALELLRQTALLVKDGFRNLVVLSPPYVNGRLSEFNNIIWTGLKALKTKNPSIRFAYVDFTPLFSVIKDAPRSFGYQFTGSCLRSPNSRVGACGNPDLYPEYIPHHPQKLTHGLMAEWVINVLSNCRS